ncbi:MAG: hypothetical protein HOO96_15690 [Polyangiaceae bacterium]|nr:hypothetical protein [Polyangiaceae bacterium]
MMLSTSRLVSLLALACACSSLKPVDVTDGGNAPEQDAAVSSDGGPVVDKDAAVVPSNACRKLVIECLDATAPKVIEVPTESTMADAIANAKAGDTIQVKGATLGPGWRVPAYVTLHGCNGAKLDGTISVLGSGATFEAFEVAGSIILNQTGNYIVRWDRFVGSSAEDAIAARSIDGLVSADVKVTVEQNDFIGRASGIGASTRYDTMTHSVDLLVRNNVFREVERPIVLTRSGLVGKISARILHNTLVGFKGGIGLYGLKEPALVGGNLFVRGTNAVEGDAAYNLSNGILSDCGEGPAPPLGGAFATGDPKFVDAANGDLRIGPGSAALDRVPGGDALPTDDFAGCPRPKGHGGTPMGDVGAYEAE